jgi:hypothetical protein
MGRRHVKEFRPDEALSLISADRAGKLLSCPSCGSQSVARDPERDSADRFANARIQLACSACGRLVSYIDRAVSTHADQH